MPRRTIIPFGIHPLHQSRIPVPLVVFEKGDDVTADAVLLAASQLSSPEKAWEIREALIRVDLPVILLIDSPLATPTGVADIISGWIPLDSIGMLESVLEKAITLRNDQWPLHFLPHFDGGWADMSHNS